ncbi:hydroxyethylthiazole kinase [Agreia sp. COWG]|uniref:hydroxyethylthiazole kinase n=1 Tax=Agreia sp. COWG TaxID=2773266 RepID=UPI001AF2415C|nr:hydroxyethylthiazole kinase [Agreia sp. COWG]CAD6010052.1 5-(2-hydroxyethyl)-4-methylthiazole kinase [Agreia sp. COWG]
MRAPEHSVSFTIDALEAVRAQTPLVQCITNSVVTNFTANVLLALGAAPAMVDIPGEAGPFASVAGGLLINLGTPTAEQRTAMIEAQTAAASAATPWVLDPVAVGSLPVRTALARQLVELRPDVIRGNASEVLALAGSGSGGRGVDASDTVDAALAAARSLALTTGGVVAVSGQVDLVTDGVRQVRTSNGHELLTRVTGGGCALGAVMAAFLAVTVDPGSPGTQGTPGSSAPHTLDATVAAITVYTVAAELAAVRSEGPGSFAMHFLDALATVDADDLEQRARIS